MRATAGTIKERIRSEILRSGAGIAGGRVPSERDLQLRYGVSRPTINRALSELAEEGLLVRPEGRRHYTIVESVSVEIPARRDSGLIGYVASDTSSLTFGAELSHRVFRGIHDAAARYGVRVLMGIAGDHVASERTAVASLIDAGAAGLVIWPFPRIGSEIETDYLIREDLGVPVVILDNCAPSQGHTQVVFDNRRAGYDVTSWLIAQGHRRIAIMSVAENSQHLPVLDRLAGYEDALADNEIPCDRRLIGRLAVDVIESRYSNKARVDDVLRGVIDAWLELDEPPTAVIALEDSIAIELIALLQDRGVRVPDDICVTGFDNLDVARLFQPTFPSTRPDFRRMGELACSLLLDQIGTGKTSARTYLLEAPVIVRGQSDAKSETDLSALQCVAR